MEDELGEHEGGEKGNQGWVNKGWGACEREVGRARTGGRERGQGKRREGKHELTILSQGQLFN